jgi:hypothetical protein
MAKSKQVFTLIAECRFNSFTGVFSTLDAAKKYWRENCQIAAREFTFVIYASEINESVYHCTDYVAHIFPSVQFKYEGGNWVPVDQDEFNRIFNS